VNDNERNCKRKNYVKFLFRDVEIRGMNHIVEEEKMTSRINEYTIVYNLKILMKRESIFRK